MRLIANRAAEKKRRQIYRSDVQIFMPFEVRTMEQLVPSVEMSVASAPNTQLSLSRSDVESQYFSQFSFRKLIVSQISLVRSIE